MNTGSKMVLQITSSWPQGLFCSGLGWRTIVPCRPNLIPNSVECKVTKDDTVHREADCALNLSSKCLGYPTCPFLLKQCIKSVFSLANFTRHLPFSLLFFVQKPHGCSWSVSSNQTCIWTHLHRQQCNTYTVCGQLHKEFLEAAGQCAQRHVAH